MFPLLAKGSRISDWGGGATVIDAASSIDSSRPLRSCTSRLREERTEEFHSFRLTVSRRRRDSFNLNTVQGMTEFVAAERRAPPVFYGITNAEPDGLRRSLTN